MNYQHNDKDDPQDYEQLFSHSFDINNNDYLSQSMPTFNQQQFDNNNNNNMFDFLNMNQDDFVLTDNLDPSIFLEANNNHNDAAFDLETQQAILLSDPTFLRQQQLLQEEQQKFQQQHYQNQQPHNFQQPQHNYQQQQQQQPPPMRSNLSAMLENNNNTASGSTMKPIPLISSQQQKKDILDKTMNGKITKPIPISSSPINTNHSMPPSFGIDHQRRFNELQARFRINKKPKQQTLGTSMPTNSSHLSTSYTDNRRRLSLEPVSSSKSVLRLNGNKIKVTTPTDPIASSFPSRTMPIQIQRVHRSNGLQNHDLEQRQKKLDDQLVKADFDDITVSELKEMLRQRGKPATGKKAVLLQRLIEERDLILHARANNIPILNRNIQSSPSPHAASLPDSMYLSSSPTIGSLNRSIADMHIGSPPMTNQQSRRFAPYSSTSPRLAPPLYSSSVPTTSNSLDMMMMQEPARVRGIKKSYAPFTSSALATPDREDDVNPFDTVKEEETMEWTDPTLDFMLQQGVNMNDKELLSFLTNQGSYPEMNFNPDLTSVMYDDTDNKSNI